MSYNPKCERCEKPEFDRALCTGPLVPKGKYLEWVCLECSIGCSCLQCAPRWVRGRDTGRKDSPFCPHCLFKQDDEFNSIRHQALQGDEFDLTCQRCDKEFFVSADVEIRYSTEVKA